MSFIDFLIDAMRARAGVLPVRCPPYTGPGTLRGVGDDYNWITVDYDKAFKALAESGCNATSIEFLSWSGYYDLARGLEPLKEAYRKALTAARKYGGILFVSVANDNQGSGKYGDTRKTLEHYETLLDAAIGFFISLGPEGQWIQPVAETKNEWSKRFEELSIKRLNAAGFVTVYNRASRPTAPGAGSDRNAYHPFTVTGKTPDVGTAEDIIVTDTGTAVSALTVGGLYGAVLNEAAVGAYARAVRAAGKRDLIIYTFTGMKKLDVVACKAVGGAWK